MAEVVVCADCGQPNVGNNATTPKQAAEFWKSIPEAVAVVLIRYAPTTIDAWDKLPEMSADDGIYWFRENSLGWDVATCGLRNGSWNWWASSGSMAPIGGASGTAESREAAQAAADAHLRKNGWLLESEAAQ